MSLPGLPRLEFINQHQARRSPSASIADSKKVVEICTKYAHEGMLNIFIAVFFATLAFRFCRTFLLLGYLFSIAIFGLYQAIFMANAAAPGTDAKKIG